jgi:hypothetical protein
MLVYVVRCKRYGDIQAYADRTKALQDVREWKAIDRGNLEYNTYYIRAVEKSDLKFLKLLNGYEIVKKTKGVYDEVRNNNDIQTKHK